ncbi:MAG: AAA family ATPase [candidate division Zixibacteria bacterium]|nr:AAA family ATPase [candidate division Zixibacteria bacterium]MDH3937986.1 AAA family ATPase [candidate division Zixibacteria bacterium]MDH4033156.1 AAA family ATPase [candidate division Zixibacteria bacterium]
MKIIGLDVKGFRSLRDIRWEPGNLNVLIGPNATGKSNLLRLLELMAVSAQGRLGKHVQRSGGMEPLVWDGIDDQICVRVKGSSLDKYGDSERKSLTYELILGRIGQSSAYRIDHELLGNFYEVELGQRDQPFKFLERHQFRAHVFDPEEKKLSAPEDQVPEQETLLSFAAGPFSVNELIPRFQEELASWCVYHDIHVNRDAMIRQPSVSRPEKRVEPDGQNLISVLHTLYTDDRDFKKDINSAMNAAFGDDFEELVFSPASDQRIELRVRWKSLKRAQSASDLSDGTLRFLFLLTVLASPSPAPVIAIDEPETGLHPSMLPIVAEYAVEASQRAQIILTTHSPQFLDAFGTTQPVTTVVRWDNGETRLRNFDDDKLAEWLKEYSLGSYFQSGELEEEA